MLKRIGTKNGLPRWEVFVRIGGKAVHRVFTATADDAKAIYGELAGAKARASLALPYSEPSLRKELAAAVSEYESNLAVSQFNKDYRVQVHAALRDFQAANKTLRYVSDCRRQHVLAYRESRSKQVAARTLNKDRDMLSGFFRWCKPWLKENPCADIPKIKLAEPPPRAADWETFCTLADYCWTWRPAVALVLEIVGETGARINEVLKADCEHVDFTNQNWHRITKGQRRLYRPLTPWVAWAARKTKAGPLCPNPLGRAGRWNYSTFRLNMHRACARLGIARLMPHTLRHGRATWEVAAGRNPRAVQELLGHSTIQMSERYFKSAQARSNAKPLERLPATVLRRCSKLNSLQRIAAHQSTLLHSSGFHRKSSKQKRISHKSKAS